MFHTVFESPLPRGGYLALELAGPATLRLRATAASALGIETSYAVVREEWPEFECSVRHDEDGTVEARTESVVVRLTTAPFGLQVTDLDGAIRYESRSPGLRIVGETIALDRPLGPSEGIFGLGEHGETFNRVPGIYRFWNTDDFIHQPFRQYYCNIPFGIAHEPDSAPHGFFLDNPGECHVRAGRPDPEKLSIESTGGEFRLWLFFEATPAEVLRQYTALTGRTPRPPLWALGFQMCRYSYTTEARVREVAAELRAREIPCDVIYLDIHYMDRFRVFSWEPKNFPDPAGLMTDLAADGFSTITIVDPAIADADYPAREEALATPNFFMRSADGSNLVIHVWSGASMLPDFTNPAVRAKWGEMQSRALLEPGVTGIWNDMNEPAIFDEELDREVPLDVLQHDEGRGRKHGEIHNVYGQSMARASREGQLAHRPQTRPFCLTRSGWAGIQRYSAVWTGDNRSAFTCMPLDIALNLNMGLSGVAFVGCDIGGFAQDATPELFTRWIEWGVFQPFCRAHTAIDTGDHEPWVFGAEAERIAREMLELRYRLLPYIYTLFVEASQTGMPVNRPLMLQYPDEAECHSIGDQFLLGRDWLVAPVLSPASASRAVYLPEGRWYHFWSGQSCEGGQWVLADARAGRPPIYIRAGAVIPMHPLRQHTKEPEPEVVILDVWPGDSLAGCLVEDDGSSFEFESGAECRTQFTGGDDGDTLRLCISKPEGTYRPAAATWLIRIHGPGRTVVDIKLDRRKSQTGHHVNGEGSIEAMIDRTHEEQRIEIRFDAR